MLSLCSRKQSMNSSMREVLLRVSQGHLAVLPQTPEVAEAGLEPELVPQLGGHDLDRMFDPLG